jgi:hypothetical protein
MFVAANQFKASVPLGTGCLKTEALTKWLIAWQSSTSSPCGTEHIWFYRFLQTFSHYGTEITDHAITTNILSRQYKIFVANLSLLS